VENARHDDAVEDLSELGEGITKRVVVGSPTSGMVRESQQPRFEKAAFSH
jgi:hypothetical protein